MANKKDYSVDDILNELEHKRTPHKDDVTPSKSRGRNLGLTDILGTDTNKDVNISKTDQKSTIDLPSAPKKDISVTSIINTDKLPKKTDKKTDKKTEKKPAQDLSVTAIINTGRTESNDKDKDKEKKVRYNQSLNKKPNLTETAKLRKIKKVNAINKALLELDSNVSNPDDLISELNPLDRLEEAQIATPESIKQMPKIRTDEIDMDSETVKQYDIRTNRKPAINEVLHKIKSNAYKDVAKETEKERRSNTALIEALNKKLEEKRLSDIEAQRTLTIPIDSESLSKADAVKRLNLDYSKQIINDTDSFRTEDLYIIENKIEDLRQKRKRKIRDFVLVDVDSEEIDEEDETEEADPALSDYNDYNDTSIILDYLKKLGRNLRTRFLVLLVLTIFSLIITVMNDHKIEIPISYFDKRHDVTAYLYTNLILGILACSAGYTVITGGLSRLMSFKIDGDSICALCMATSIAGVAVQLINTDYIQRSISHVYISAAIMGLLFNTIGKLYIMNRTRRNFRFVSGDFPKYAGFLVENKSEAEAFVSGMMQSDPVLAGVKKTEFLSDFLKSSYSYDLMDSISKILAPVTVVVATALGLAAYFNASGTSGVYWAMTVFNAVVCVCSPFSLMLIVNRPLSVASKAMEKSSAAILGYDAIDSFADTNSVLIDASKLFPEGSVGLRNAINKLGKEKGAVVNVDEALITAASLAVHSGSIMSHMFMNIVDGKREMLYKVNGCVYEDSMGVSGWISGRRVMLGNRDQMKNHSIKVPGIAKEHKYTGKGSEGVYLAISGEIITLFLIEMRPNPEVQAHMKMLEKAGIKVVIKTTDSLVSINKLSEMFEVDPDMLKVLPYRLHENFDENTKYTSNANGSFSCSGTFTSFAGGILTIRRLLNNAIFMTFFQIAMIILGVLLIGIFTVFSLNANIAPLNVIIFNLIGTCLIMIIQTFWKY